jgi:hypothetical protein
MPSSPPPDRFQREIDDIIKLAERRLEHQSFGYRMRKSTRRLGGVFGNFSVRLPSVEAMGGMGLAFLLLAWLLQLPLINGMPFAPLLLQITLILGIVLLIAAIVGSVMRRGSGGASSIGSGGDRMWRGERISYGSPYGPGLLGRIRRIFRGR